RHRPATPRHRQRRHLRHPRRRTRHDQRRRLALISRTPEKGTGALTTAAGTGQARTQGRRPPPDRRQADRPHSHAAGAGYQKPGFPLIPNRPQLVAISHTLDYGWAKAKECGYPRPVARTAISLSEL